MRRLRGYRADDPFADPQGGAGGCAHHELRNNPRRPYRYSVQGSYSLGSDILVDQLFEAVNNLIIIEIHPFEHFFDVGCRQLEGAIVGNVADNEIDVLILADE